MHANLVLVPSPVATAEEVSCRNKRKPCTCTVIQLVYGCFAECNAHVLPQSQTSDFHTPYYPQTAHLSLQPQLYNGTLTGQVLIMSEPYLLYMWDYCV